jgi:CubicO group peptidase (beta-lactamase class C family)
MAPGSIGQDAEAVSGMSLEGTFKKHLLRPLGWWTASILKRSSAPVANHTREADGTQETARTQHGKTFNGGGGLYSTVADYVRFMQMILKKGAGPDGKPILSATPVRMMSANQTGSLQAGKMRSFSRTVRRRDHPGERPLRSGFC